jgi:antitoxin component YwqK of YwqJK toxin-antitoxin module
MAKNSNAKIKHEKYYYTNGNIKAEYYLLNNKHHRIGGPAYISYFENGNVRSYQYCLNSKPIGLKVLLSFIIIKVAI